MHENNGVGFDITPAINNTQNYSSKHITLHGSSVVVVNDDTLKYQNISIFTTNHTILQISHTHTNDEDIGNNKLAIVCHHNQQNIKFVEDTTDDGNDDDNENLIGQDTLIDISSTTTSTSETTIENDLIGNGYNNHERLIAKHSKRSSSMDKEENFEEIHMLQNDDPRLIAYNDPENVEFISLDDKSPSQKWSNTHKEDVPVTISAVPLTQSGVPHYVVKDAKTNDKGIETGPRILVNVSIATDHGSGTQTHAVYMLHVMVPAGVDLNPKTTKEEDEFAPENLIQKPIEYVKYPSDKHPNDTPDVSINTIANGDYKGKIDPFSIRNEQPTKTISHSTDKKEEDDKELPRKTILSQNITTTTTKFSNESMVVNNNNSNDTKNTFVFDKNLNSFVVSDDENNDERKFDEETTKVSLSSTTSSYIDDNEEKEESPDEILVSDVQNNNDTMGGDCNCNHTIPYVLILEGEGKNYYLGFINT